ncbi:hypothetical protein [Streptomyces sp. NPDC088246]|uniref:hypothetical protein n=1 Tax=Streptomyces sp. NPDC088246 TaxID=3365842 RepID=UPI00381A43CD
MTRPPRPPRTRGLGRSFWLLFTGESASALGTAASVIALPVVALRRPGPDTAALGARTLRLLAAATGLKPPSPTAGNPAPPRSPMNPRSTI